MADADWVKYKNIRGRQLPSSVLIRDQLYRQEKVLKFDFYAVTGVFRRVGEPAAWAHTPAPERVIVKIYHSDPAWCPPLAWLGKYLALREQRYLEAVAGIPGVPAWYAALGATGLAREYIEGVNLREFSRVLQKRVDAAFFPELHATLAAVHARGLAHNDLSKPENIMVTPEGRPVLIDFQIALAAGRLLQPLIRYMQSVDRYHLRKIHRRQRPEDFTPQELAAARRKNAGVWLHGYIRRPYRAMRHLILSRFLMAHAAHDRTPGMPHLDHMPQTQTQTQPQPSSVRRKPDSRSTSGT